MWSSNSQGIKSEMYEVAEQLTTLIVEGIVRLGDEGNTFDPVCRLQSD